jgi:hypothetical protein
MSSGKHGGLVQQWAGVEDLEYFGVRPADNAEVTAGQAGQQAGQLAT